MNQAILFAALLFLLLLIVVHWAARKRRKLEAEVQSARRVDTLAGFRMSRTYSLEETLRQLLATLSRAYASKDATLEFHGTVFGDHSITVGGNDCQPIPLLENESYDTKESNQLRNGFRRQPETNEGNITFIVNDEDFSCRVELNGGTSPTHGEYRHIQELMREKISWVIYEKTNRAAIAALEEMELPYAVFDVKGRPLVSNGLQKDLPDIDKSEISKAICNLCAVGRDQILLTMEKSKRKVVVRRVDRGLFAAFFPFDSFPLEHGSADAMESLLYQALDDLNMGAVLLSQDERRQDTQYRITKINKAFYRIFGLEGSNAQSDEVEEILTSAMGPDETKRFSVGAPHSITDFSYMRRDGLKVRARLTTIKAPDASSLIIFEPVDDTDFLISSYRRLLDAAQDLYTTGDVRQYLREIRDATNSDGIALARRAPNPHGFELREKVGFIINVPQLLLEDIPSRELINAQGYLVVPMKERGEVAGALIALKPSEDAIQIALIGAKLLEAHNLLRRENHEVHLQNMRYLAEAKRADEATKLKSEFLASMSHEIRTPLNSIIGFADIIQSEGKDLPKELMSEFSGNIVTAGRHLLSLINDILDLTKVETGKMKLDLQEFSIGEVVESIQRILKPPLDKGHVTLQTKIEEGLDAFIADAVKFKQILYNLLNNAITYSPQGSTVKLEIGRSADGIEIKVIDKGAGIKKEDIDRLFKPFSQLDGKKGGSGLGLLLTRRLAELHGGAIWIDSEYGNGTTVVAYLPNCPAGIAEAKTDKSGEDEKESVLFVTSDKHLFDLLAAIVDGMGFTLERIEPELVEEQARETNEDTVWVIDASPENLNEGVISACRDASKVLLLTGPEDTETVSRLLEAGSLGNDYESKVSFIDRRNFTKSELLAELNMPGH